ncbi:Type II secretion system protein E [Sterolibacterium denitrificans]|uniref:Type II secretion system protein E n=1 Tax=Sterolibacterium denitrificans TaxID=157592 RepID=A0A7Z7HQQ7_9PROT|nr:GspE/PulE family protein [Sterolibacterium denitrificans]SMB24068.1 Type II secretion system protein E [Sterolibacterium denitrificans]
MSRPEKIRLGDFLIAQGLLTNEQLGLALEEQKRSGRKLGRIFIEAGYVSEKEITKALGRQLRAPFVDLVTFKPKPELINLLTEAAARRYRAIVLDNEEDVNMLMVGFADPTDLVAYDEVSRILQREIMLAVVMESQLLTTLDRVYRHTEEISGLTQELAEDMLDGQFDFGNLEGVLTTDEDAPVVKLLNTVFEEAIKQRASDIHIEPQEKQLIIRFRIDGVLHVQTEAHPRVAAPLVLRLKLISGLDISEKRLPQDGRFNIKLKNSAVDVRLSTLPTQYGESAVMRLLSQSNNFLALDKMGMPPTLLERLRHAIHRPSGMVLVTGPTGSGKTTTLYSALAELNSPEKKILTVEDPIEYRLPGINQTQVMEKIDLTFSRVLRAALRQDPDIILVGEMRDQETAEIGMRAAMTGHMVLSTLHTNDALTTPIRLLDMGVPRFMVAMSLQLVLAQRLVRTICERCADEYKPTPQELAWLRMELGDEADSKTFYRGYGCDNCNKSGYTGRQAIYECLEMTQVMVDAANHGDPQEFLRAGREQMAGNTLRRDALRLALAGRSTIEEVMRINNQMEG